MEGGRRGGEKEFQRPTFGCETLSDVDAPLAAGSSEGWGLISN
jgi:hypothetical protein